PTGGDHVPPRIPCIVGPPLALRPASTAAVEARGDRQIAGGAPRPAPFARRCGGPRERTDGGQPVLHRGSRPGGGGGRISDRPTGRLPVGHHDRRGAYSGDRAGGAQRPYRPPSAARKEPATDGCGRRATVLPP